MPKEQYPIYDIMRHLKATGDQCEKLYKILDDNKAIIWEAQGSQHNHQAWEGGYLQHVADTMELAIMIYREAPWPTNLQLSSIILVIFLHDIEKPFMQRRMAEDSEMPVWSKEQRLIFRKQLIEEYDLHLTDEEYTALRYIEGEGGDYSPTERKINPLGALCHAADVMSARLYPDRNKPE